MSQDGADADQRLDVRAIEGEPFGEIMAALDDLPPEESLLLVNSFEPEPLYDVLEERGFEYDVTDPEPDVWQVRIRRG